MIRRMILKNGKTVLKERDMLISLMMTMINICRKRARRRSQRQSHLPDRHQRAVQGRHQNMMTMTMMMMTEETGRGKEKKSGKDAASKKKVLEQVRRVMRPGSVLITGAAEGVAELIRDLETTHGWLHRVPATMKTGAKS